MKRFLLFAVLVLATVVCTKAQEVEFTDDRPGPSFSGINLGTKINCFKGRCLSSITNVDVSFGFVWQLNK